MKRATRIEDVFGVRRVLLPVVHPIDERTALASVEVAREAGCKGVFLINQGMSSEEVLELVMRVRRETPALWVGINLLGDSASETLRRGLDACDGRLDGIWTDNAGIEEGAPVQPRAQEFVECRRELAWNGLWFGGVAFKYQRSVPADQLALAAETAAAYMDVVCTSGPGTGQAAETDKVVRMRAGLPAGGALALASGVTDENVAAYLPHVDAFLVGTGIEREFGVLDREKVTRLQQQVASWTAT